MKKFLFILSFTLFLCLFNETDAKALSNGTCILKQQSSTYQISTPFYFYEVIQNSTYNDLLVNSLNYTHTSTIIENSEDCLAINNKAPTYQMGINGNALNSRTTTYYFSSNILNDSKYIYEESLKIFKIPDLVYQSNFEITTTYISLDDLPPIIVDDKIDSIILANVNVKISVEQLKAKITAYDDVDGIIDVEIYEDNYSPNYTTLGTYTIIFAASDKSGNTSYLTISIKTIDNIKPQITGQSKFNSYMSNPLTIEEIKSTLKITDNYDKDLYLIEVYEDFYTQNTNKEGDFKISFITTDNSNNKSLPFTITVKVIDDIPPQINGENSYKVNVKNILNIENLAKQLVAIDNVDSSPTIELEENTYTENYYKVGIYQISFIAKDKNNNISAPFTINIITEDTDKPIFYISKKFISVDSSLQIPIEELITLINEINNIDSNTITNVNVIENSYSDNFNKEGLYTLKLEYTYDNFPNKIIESNIIVEDYLKKDTQNKNTPKNSFWSVIKNLFAKIWKFITSIFLWFKKLI